MGLSLGLHLSNQRTGTNLILIQRLNKPTKTSQKQRRNIALEDRKLQINPTIRVIRLVIVTI